jgi:hypothetical protein
MVVDQNGTGLAGAVLQAEGCATQSDATGHYSVRCDPANYQFAVSHPNYLSNVVQVDATHWGDIPVAKVTLTSVPDAPGLYAQHNGLFVPIAPALFQREQSEDSLHYCSSGSPTAIAKDDRWLDVHGVDWRIYAIGSDHCFYHLKRVKDNLWSGEDHAIAPASAEAYGERLEGIAWRQWVHPGLAPGDYAIVEWLDGTFVPEDVGQGSYRGWLIHVQ